MLDADAVARVHAACGGRRLGVVVGGWDLLHAGHCLLLEFARRNCDFLVAGLHADPARERPFKNAPVLTLAERRTLIAANRNVDAVVEYETEADHVDLLVLLGADVRFLGSDYIGRPYAGHGLAVETVFHDRAGHGWSSSDLRRRVWEAEQARRR